MAGLLDSPFTFGVEYEPMELQYRSRPGELHYDREKIFSIGKLYSTIEFFSKGFPKSCVYNMELVLGVYRLAKLRHFLIEKRYQTSDIKEDLDSFKKDFLVNQADYLSFLIKKSDLDESLGSLLSSHLYADCALTERSGQEDEFAYASYENVKDLINIQGVPQVTFGLSYAFFLPLLETDTNSVNFLEMLEVVLEPLEFPDDLEQGLVIKNFLAVLAYYSYMSSTFTDAPYFKAMFPFKPRTNPGKSYHLLKEKYPALEQVAHQLHDALSGLFEHTEEYTVLQYKTEALSQMVSKRVSGGNLREKYTHMMRYAMNHRPDYNQIVYDMMCIDLLYLLRKVFSPERVVKITKLNPDKVNMSSPIMEGYVYRYNDEDRILLEQDTYLLGYEVIEDAYASLQQLPTLYVKDGLLHASSRLEVFEWIAEDTNLILECRAAEDFVEYEEDGVTLNALGDFIERFLTKTTSVLNRFLIRQGILSVPKREVVAPRPRPQLTVSSLLTGI